MIRLLEHYIFPIWRYRMQDGAAWITSLEGTGFFISRDGAYVTAKHVLDEGLARAREAGEDLGVCPHLVGTRLKMVAKVANFDAAPPPYDIAVGKVDVPSDTTYVVGPYEVGVWQDVATFGYPESVVNLTVSEFQVQARAHKGYVQRVVPKGRMPTGSHPTAFELSFPISRGLSGSPLFIHLGEHDHAIGVCVGSQQSRLVDYEEVVASNDGLEERKSFYRVEEFGIAHDLRDLADWRPTCLEGRSLGDLGARVKNGV